MPKRRPDRKIVGDRSNVERVLVGLDLVSLKGTWMTNETDAPHDRSVVFERVGHEARQQSYVLRLYVAGATPASLRAVQNAKRICQEHLGGRYTLEIIDLYENRALAREEQIVAAPTLVKRFPPPVRRLIGDLSDTEKVLSGLELRGTSDEA